MNRPEKYKNLTAKTAAFLLPVVIFFCISALCFLPQFSGNVLPQHDIEQYAGMSADLRQYTAQTGDDAQWTGGMFGGMPAYLISVRYPSQIVKNTVGQVVKIVKTPAGFIFFAMVAMWVMMLMFGLSPWVGMVAALAYGLSTYFFLIIGAGHVTKMWALVYAPLMMGGAFTTLRGNIWTGGILTALFASLEIGANHPQITYYFLLAMAAFWLSELIFALRHKRAADFAKRTVVLAAAGIVAAGSNFAPLWYTSQHSPDTIRGGSELTAESGSGDGLDLAYATAWSYGVAESWNMLIPDFAGGDSSTAFNSDGEVAKALAPYGLRQAARQLPAYWGGQPYTAGPTYLGAAAIFFALLGLLLVSARDRWWIAAVMLVMLLLAWGRNFMPFTEFCFKYLPLYNKFRTVSMTLTVIEWAVPMLAGFALWRMWQSDTHSAQIRRQLLKKVAWAAGVTGGICLLFIVAGGALFDFGQSQAEEDMTVQFYYMLRAGGADDAIAQGLHEELAADTAAAMAADRAQIMRADAWRSLIFILLSAAAAALFVLRKTGRAVLIAAAAMLITLDLALVDMRFLPHDRFVPERKAKTTPTAADLQIMADKDLGFRVYNLTVSPFNDATTSNFHRSVGGYHGAKLARYQDIIDLYLQVGNESEEVLDMLNTRYIIGRDGTVEHRPTANGAAWFVERVIALPSAADEIEALDIIDTKSVAVASPRIKSSKRSNDVPEGDYAAGTIRLAEYAPNRLRYEYTAEGDAFAVFSEIFYDKGWQAFIDGSTEPSPVCRVDYILRGMPLPSGTHTVEWRFRAPAWGAVSAVTAIFSLLILAAAAALAITATIRKIRK